MTESEWIHPGPEMDPQERVLVDQQSAWAMNNLSEMVQGAFHHMMEEGCTEELCVGTRLGLYIQELEPELAKMVLVVALTTLARMNLTFNAGVFENKELMNMAKAMMDDASDMEEVFKKILEEHDGRLGE